MVRGINDDKEIAGGGMSGASPEVRRLGDIVRKLELRLTGAEKKTNEQADSIKTLTNSVGLLQQGVSSTPPSPVANFLWNGELGHSVNSWHDAAYVTTDSSKECAWFFSHYKPFVPITFVDADVDLGANTITFTEDHEAVTGHAVVFTSTDGAGDAPPVPLTAGTVFYVIKISATIIKVASTYANALTATALDLTAVTSGTHTMQPKLLATDARSSSTNFALKRTEGTHSTYSLDFSDWNAVSGTGRLNGLMSIGTPVPNNMLEPGMTAYLGIRSARRNQYIDIPDELLMYGGIFDNTDANGGDFLKGSLGFDAVATRDGLGSNLTRHYRMFVQTDRGYSILSPEVIVADGVPDGGYNATNFVELSWSQVAGYLNIELWMYTPSTGVYRLLEETSSGTSTFIDNGAFRRTDVGYPTASSEDRKAVFVTRVGELTELAIDGGTWDTILFPAYIPDNYNRALTTDRQWALLGMTLECDLLVDGVTAPGGSGVVTAPAAVFEAAYDAIYDAGALVAKLYDSTGALVYTTTVTNRISTTQVTLAVSPAAATYTLRIVGGGFHGILVDKIHLGLQRNTTFAPNPLDARTLQPVALPTGQGGVGTGGGDEGGVTCVPYDEPVELVDTILQASRIHKGNYVLGENMRPNTVLENHPRLGRVRPVRMANGVEKSCTDSHRFRISRFDEVGAPLYTLRVGDRVMTHLDGRDELSPIVSIGKLSEPIAIQMLVLTGGHYYRAGRWVPTLWQSVLIGLGLMKRKTGSAYAHNRKREGEFGGG